MKFVRNWLSIFHSEKGKTSFGKNPPWHWQLEFWGWRLRPLLLFVLFALIIGVSSTLIRPLPEQTGVALVSTRDLSPGSVLHDSDVQKVAIPRRLLTTDLPEEPAEVRALMTKSGLKTGQLIYSSDLAHMQPGQFEAVLALPLPNPHLTTFVTIGTILGIPVLNPQGQKTRIIKAKVLALPAEMPSSQQLSSLSSGRSQSMVLVSVPRSDLADVSFTIRQPWFSVAILG